MVRIAVLDDYQNIALSKGDWSGVPDAQVQTFQDHIAEEDALAKRLEPEPYAGALR